MVANNEAPDGFYQITNHYDNIYGKDNDYSQSYETPESENAVLPILVIQFPAQKLHNCPRCIRLERNISVFKLKG